MEKYDYRKVMTDNIKDWITMNNMIEYAHKEGWSRDFFSGWLDEELWDHDAITGNGTYGFAPEDLCEEYVSTNLKLYFEAAREFDDFPTGDTPWVNNNPAKHMDTTIRCYLLYECIDKALEELNYENLSSGPV